MSVTPATVSLSVGQEDKLAVVVTGTSTTMMAIDQSVRWSASNGNATVSTTGVVRGVSPGTTVMTATSVPDPTKQGTAVITILPPILPGL